MFSLETMKSVLCMDSVHSGFTAANTILLRIKDWMCETETAQADAESRVLVTPKLLDQKLPNPLLLLSLHGPASLDLYNQDGDLPFSADVDNTSQLESRLCSYL